MSNCTKILYSEIFQQNWLSNPKRHFSCKRSIILLLTGFGLFALPGPGCEMSSCNKESITIRD